MKKLQKKIDSLETEIVSLQKEVKSLNERFDLNEKYAILAQFAINIEYELKEMFLKFLRTKDNKTYNEVQVVKTELTFLEDEAGVHNLPQILSDWFGNVPDIQTKYETLKESLRWMKSYFTGIAQPTTFS